MSEKTGFVMVREVTLVRYLPTGYPACVRKNRFCNCEGCDVGQVIHLPTGYPACVRKNRFCDGEGGDVGQVGIWNHFHVPNQVPSSILMIIFVGVSNSQMRFRFDKNNFTKTSW